MLKAAGLKFTTQQPKIDERALEQILLHLSPAQIALKLAHAKALSLDDETKSVWIIGADQILEFEGQVIHKAQSINEAILNLRLLSGQMHQLHSAVCVVQNNELRFSHLATATLYMRNLSKEFLQTYSKSEPEALLHSVGGYHVEGIGIQLFDHIEGDIHTIMGMPLLPLLAFLRQTSIIQT